MGGGGVPLLGSVRNGSYSLGLIGVPSGRALSGLLKKGPKGLRWVLVWNPL